MSDVEEVRMCWHLTDPDSWLFHNVFLGKGWTRTVTAIAQEFGPGFATQYQISNSEPDKEDLWERIRLQVAPDAPSRMGSFYLFESEQDADVAMSKWFSGHHKIRLQVLTFPPSITTVHRADSKWLNHPRPEWENAARQYWSGATSSEPMVELIAQGSIFFPGWERPPFGLKAPVRSG
jgi:hypothetical protein